MRNVCGSQDVLIFDGYFWTLPIVSRSAECVCFLYIKKKHAGIIKKDVYQFNTYNDAIFNNIVESETLYTSTIFFLYIKNTFKYKLFYKLKSLFRSFTML